MKLLGWMHRKFRQNNGETSNYRDFNAGYGYPCNCLPGRSSLEETEYYGGRKPSRFPVRRSTDDRFHCRGGTRAGDPDEDAPPAVEDLFQGLLTIGTLGSLEHSGEDDGATGIATPTFGVPAFPLVSVDAIAEKEDGYEATEDDLMFINAELEKVLLAPEAEKAERMSSARASQVSAKQLVVTGFPLQGYLLAGAVAAAEKKEHQRTSLGELFMRSRMLEEEEGWKKEKPTAGMHLIVKKMLKRRGSAASSRTAACNPAGDGTSSQPVGSETKFHKIMQIFHRKVHPESLVASKKTAKASKSRSNSMDGEGEIGANKGLIAASANGSLKEEGELNMKNNQAKSPDAAVVGGHDCSDSSGNREHWIKTDADYLVLEL